MRFFRDPLQRVISDGVGKAKTCPRSPVLEIEVGKIKANWEREFSIECPEAGSFLVGAAYTRLQQHKKASDVFQRIAKSKPHLAAPANVGVATNEFLLTDDKQRFDAHLIKIFDLEPRLAGLLALERQASEALQVRDYFYRWLTQRPNLLLNLDDFTPDFTQIEGTNMDDIPPCVSEILNLSAGTEEEPSPFERLPIP